MRFALLSDCHLCVDKPVGRLDGDMLQVGINKLTQVFEMSADQGVTYILQAGDFVDIKRSWELLSTLSKFLEAWKKKGITLCCVLGQHDSYYHDMTNEKTIMGVLISTGLIKRLNHKPLISNDNIMAVYGSSFGEEIPQAKPTHRNILVCHRQILMKKIWNKQEDYEYAPAFLKQHNNYDLILCGDAHQKFDFKLDNNKIICNSGPLMRLEATDAMIEHQPGFYIYDLKKTKSLSWHNINAKRGDEVLSKEHIAIQKMRKQNFDDFIGKIQEVDGKNQSLDFNQNLQMIIKQSNAGVDIKHKISEYLAKGA